MPRGGASVFRIMDHKATKLDCESRHFKWQVSGDEFILKEKSAAVIGLAVPTLCCARPQPRTHATTFWGAGELCGPSQPPGRKDTPGCRVSREGHLHVPPAGGQNSRHGQHVCEVPGVPGYPDSPSPLGPAHRRAFCPCSLYLCATLSGTVWVIGSLI